MTALNLADQIDYHSFSFLMARDAEGSTIDFGTPKTEERIAEGTELEYIRTLDDFYWSALCQGFAMGSTENAWKWGSVEGEFDTVSLGQVYSIFDTGSTAIILPSFYFNHFLGLLFEAIGETQFHLEEGYVFSKCYDNFPTIHFLFDNKWIAVEPVDYMIDASAA